MFDKDFRHIYGDSRRLKHYESGKLSECYYPIEFSFVFEKLHRILFENYSLYFEKIGHENEIGEVDAATLFCEFSPTLSKNEQNRLLQRLMQW